MGWLKEKHTQEGIVLLIGPYHTPLRVYAVKTLITFISVSAFMIVLLFLHDLYTSPYETSVLFRKYLKFEWRYWMSENPLQLFLGALGLVVLSGQISRFADRLTIFIIGKYGKVIFTPEKVKIRRFFWYRQYSRTDDLTFEIIAHPKGQKTPLNPQMRKASYLEAYEKTGIVVMRYYTGKPIRIATIYDFRSFQLGHKAEQLAAQLQLLLTKDASGVTDKKPTSMEDRWIKNMKGKTMKNNTMTIILYSPETSQGKSSFAREFLAAAARDGQDYQDWINNPKLQVLGIDQDKSREGKEHTLIQWKDNLEFDVKMPMTINDSLNGNTNGYDVQVIDYGGAPDKETLAQMMQIEEGLIICFITFDEKGYRLGINKLRQLSRFQKTLGILSHVKVGEAQEQNRDTQKLSKALKFYRDDVLSAQFEHHKIINTLYPKGLLAGMSKNTGNDELALMRNMNAIWQEVKRLYGDPYRQ